MSQESEKIPTPDSKSIEVTGGNISNEPKNVSGISIKDKIALCISAVALLISGATFVMGRIDAKARNEKEASELALKLKVQYYKSYNLGQQVVSSFLYWFEAPKGQTDPQKLADAKEYGAFEIAKLQQLADLLDLRITDVRALFTTPGVAGRENRIDPSQPFMEIDRRIDITYDKKTVAAYEIGYASLLTYARSRLYAGNVEATQSLLNSYGRIAGGINQNLAELGIKKTVSNRLTTLPDITKEMGGLKEYLEHLWAR